MMPFFALMMLESRLRRFRQGRVDEFKQETATPFNFEDAAHREWLEYSAKAANKGYHRELLLSLWPGTRWIGQILTLFMGASLIYSGWTGVCAWVPILSQAWWNRRKS